jgi:arginine metabolism regulation protein II
MPTNRSTTRKPRKPQKPRRTHNLGDCATCRRRHVKCDQARPHCSVCRNANLECDGFPSPIRWVSSSTGPTPGKSSNPLKATATSPKHSRQSFSNETATSVPNYNLTRSNDNADACEGYSTQQQPPTAFSQHVGSDLEGSGVLGEHNAEPSSVPAGTGIVNDRPFDGNDSTDLPMVDPMVDWNWLFDVSSGLGWNDLFDSTAPLSMMPTILASTLGDHMDPGVQSSGQAWD